MILSNLTWSENGGPPVYSQYGHLIAMRMTKQWIEGLSIFRAMHGPWTSINRTCMRCSQCGHFIQSYLDFIHAKKKRPSLPQRTYKTSPFLLLRWWRFSPEFSRTIVQKSEVCTIWTIVGWIKAIYNHQTILNCFQCRNGQHTHIPKWFLVITMLIHHNPVLK